MATNLASADVAKHRLLGGTARLRLRATRMEAATGWRIDHTRDLTAQHDPRSPLRRIDRRVGRQQRGGVGMRRRREQRPRCRLLDDLPEIHHHRTRGYAANHIEVVAGDEIGQPEIRVAGPATDSATRPARTRRAPRSARRPRSAPARAPGRAPSPRAAPVRRRPGADICRACRAKARMRHQHFEHARPARLTGQTMNRHRLGQQPARSSCAATARRPRPAAAFARGGETPACRAPTVRPSPRRGD